ncbi:MAG: DAK2 domain-containing protein [Caldanaerobacter sp.]
MFRESRLTIKEEGTLKNIEGKILKNMIITGANYLYNNRSEVDKLNVFPVPDGDTGTNMAHTLLYAAKELEKTGDTIREVLETISKGTLMGAKGNSGVILSQIFRGFTRELKGLKKITTCDFAKGLKAGVETAYKAVMRPVEGTILTVARETAEEAINICREVQEFEDFLEILISKAEQSLKNTPNLLPILKEAGVVDSGGTGFVYVLRGMLEGLKGNKIELQEVFEDKKELKLPEGELKYLYCTEILVKTNKSYSEALLKERFKIFGDSLVVVAEDDLLKVHVHTNNPGLVLEEGVKIGELIKVKIDNMKFQHETIIEENKKPNKKYGILVVATGDGVKEIFKNLGCDVIIDGGQTMNPSTNEILRGIEKINAEHILVFPNNKNIVMACEQAKKLTDKKVEVIPTRNFNEAIAAILALDLEKGFDENIKDIEEVLKGVKTIEVTFAVRKSKINGFDIKEGDILGFVNEKLEMVGKDYNEVAKNLIMNSVTPETSLVTIYYGKDVTREEAETLRDFVSDQLDVEVHYGGQPLYYYVISLE